VGINHKLLNLKLRE